MQQGKLLPRRFQWNEGLDRPYLLSPGEREHTVTLPDHFSILIAITGSEIGAPQISPLQCHPPESSRAANILDCERKFSVGVRPSPGAATWVFSNNGTLPNRPPIPPGCGRDGRTPPTQKFNFGVRVKTGSRGSVFVRLRPDETPAPPGWRPAGCRSYAPIWPNKKAPDCSGAV